MDANHSSQRPTVLVVDDEPQHLQLAQYVLAKQHDVVTALNADLALSIARSRPIDVALVDYRMPGVSGIELLQQLRDIVPGCMRFLVTAYSNEDVLQEAINSAAVYRFVAKPVDYATLGSDIRRALEHRQALLQAEYSNKMAMAGMLASIAVHDLRNSLQGLSLIPFYLDDPNPENLQQARATLTWSQETMTNCISEVLIVVKGGTPIYEMALGSLRPVIEGTVAQYRAMHPRQRFVLNLAPDLPAIRHSERHVRRMLSNLMGNAAQATADGGTITVSAHRTDTGHLAVLVQDDGEGMSAVVQRHLFEPLFTTKGVGGVGLGLRLCQSVMTAHDGQLTFTSAPTAGTTFTALFPLPA